MKNKQMATYIVIAVVALGAGFYGGTSYAASHSARGAGYAANGTRTPGGMMGTGTRGTRAGGFSSGTVLSKDATGITIKMANGSTEIVLTSPTTSVSKSASGVLTDVTVGASVLVTGTSNSDGSLTASTIQLRPVVQ